MKIDTNELQDRRYVMFLLGTKDAEISRCLEQSRKQLIVAGAKADTLPTKHEQKIKFILRLRDKALQVICKWLAENADFSGLPSVEEVLSEENHDKDNTSEPNAEGEELHKFWRAILAAYVRTPRSAAVEEYLKTKVPTVTAVNPAETAKASPPAPSTSAQEEPRATAATASCITSSKAIRLSATVVADPVELPVLAYRSHHLQSGQFFIDIVGLIQGDDLIELSAEEGTLLFPETGDATAFPGTGPTFNSSFDGLSIWRVKHGNREKKTQFIVDTWLAHVYDVFNVPHPSTDPDKVRAWIQKLYTPASNIYPVFHLTDGLLVKIASDTSDPRHADFDLPLHAYRAIHAIEWKGRTIIIKPLPAPDFKYDCAPPGTLVKRLFKQKSVVEGLPQITKNQLQVLAELAEQEADGKGIRQSTTRIASKLEEVFTSRDVLEEVFLEIMALPTVKSEINAAKARALEEHRKELAIEEKAVDALRIKKKSLEEEIERHKAANKREAADMAREIKKAFERASEESFKTLANVALLKPFLQPQQIEASNRNGETSTAPCPPVDRNASAGSQDIKATPRNIEWKGAPLLDVKGLNLALAKRCIVEGLSQCFMKAIVSAAASQGVVGLLGAQQKVVARSLAALLSGGVTCRVSITGDMFGPADLLNAPAIVATDSVTGMALGEFLGLQQAAGKPSIVILDGANRAPPESYIPELLAATQPSPSNEALAWTDRKGNVKLVQLLTPVIFLLCFSSGRSTFPLVPPLAWNLPIFDTDSKWHDMLDPEDDVPVSESFIDPSLWSSMAGRDQRFNLQLLSNLTPGSRSAAMRMKFAASRIDMDEADAELFSLAAYGYGRSKGAAVAEVLSVTSRQVTSHMQEYFRSADEAALSTIFDIHEGAAG
ncbi:hypothetical protein EDC30_11085 [Paucimonas lemoignei]|uniref:Uncharacterized protein n=1 Tax=Paucimonas lemoignei TaxID=29443 RepID=A0A4R3HR81_PAULE|nr:hypothetical protein [Paucimonas lemoignei]TCS35616.1 hypothetical protein EDC30_11085 [Paucimonas lemoignei]